MLIKEQRTFDRTIHFLNMCLVFLIVVDFLAQHGNMSTSGETAKVSSSKEERRYVYGLAGIARLFGCSLPTANRIKQSGKINRAITQVGRKIIVDADLALELAGRKTGGRG